MEILLGVLASASFLEKVSLLVVGAALTGIIVPVVKFRMDHVWTAPAVQEESDYQRSVRVRSCIRPLSAAVWPLALM